MAGDWIKMRAGLMQSPRLIGMARRLVGIREFRDWLTPGGGSLMNGQIVSDDALRCVTIALLLRVWSASREFGKHDGVDLILPFITPADLDVMAGCPGVGEAMIAVGWAVKETSPRQIRLPKFAEHNAPMGAAEKQAAYRDRKRNALRGVTDEDNGALPDEGNKTVTREEKRRDIFLSVPAGFAEFWAAYPRKKKRPQAEQAWRRQAITPDDLPAVMAGLTRDKQSEQWQTPRFIPHPATWLNGRCWEDGPEPTGGETPPATDRPFVY